MAVPIQKQHSSGTVEFPAGLIPARSLRGKSAIVTGSTSGIGAGIARELAQAGANIVLNGFGDAKAIEKTQTRFLKDYGISSIYSEADIAKPAEIDRMVEIARDEFGHIDILVNNAGVFHVEPIDALSPEQWDTTIAVNLSSAFYTIRAVLPDMREHHWGRIINVASALGLVGSPNASAYAASKHGVIGITKCVALEAAQSGITVNAICPGYTMTPLIEREIRETARMNHLPENQVKDGFLDQVQPTKRFVDISEIAALVKFLCTDAAASITGAALSVDGGWTAH